MQIREIAEGVSLALTSPTVVLGMAVVGLWWRQAHISFRARKKTPMDWFVVGVFVGFLGGVADNVFWGIAWSLEFLGMPEAKEVFSWGAFFNVFFRQACGTAAAYCHIRAAVENKNDKRLRRSTLTKMVNYSFLGGFLFWAVLHFLK